MLLHCCYIALLEPPQIKIAEARGDFTPRLALQEKAKTLPFGTVWDFYCAACPVPEIANVFSRAKIDFHQLTGMLHDYPICWRCGRLDQGRARREHDVPKPLRFAGALLREDAMILAVAP